MVPACRQETREYMNFGVPSVFLTLGIKKWPGLAGSTVLGRNASITELLEGGSVYNLLCIVLLVARQGRI